MTKNRYLMRCFAYAQHDGKEILRCAQDDRNKKKLRMTVTFKLSCLTLFGGMTLLGMFGGMTLLGVCLVKGEVTGLNRKNAS